MAQFPIEMSRVSQRRKGENVKM